MVKSGSPRADKDTAWKMGQETASKKVEELDALKLESNDLASGLFPTQQPLVCENFPKLRGPSLVSHPWTVTALSSEFA